MKRGAESNQIRASKKLRVINYNSAMRKVGKGDYADFQQYLKQTNSPTYELTFHDKSTKKERADILEHFAKAIIDTPIIELIVNNYDFKESGGEGEEAFIDSLATTKLQSITYKDAIAPISNDHYEAPKLTKFDRLVALSSNPSSSLNALKIAVHPRAMLSKNLVATLARSNLKELTCRFDFFSTDQADALSLAIKLSTIQFLKVINTDFIVNSEMEATFIKFMVGLQGSPLKSLRLPHVTMPISIASRFIDASAKTDITHLEISLTLSQEHNNPAIDNLEIEKLIQALKKSKLQSLTVQSPLKQEHVARILAALKDSPTLKEIKLRSYGIEPQYLIDISSSIQSANYTSIGLSNCKFDLDSINSFSQSISRLKKLKLAQSSFTNPLTVMGAAPMGFLAQPPLGAGDPDAYKMLSILFKGLCNSSIQYLSLEGRDLDLSLVETDSLMHILQASQVTRLNLQIFNPSEEAIKTFTRDSNIHRVLFNAYQVDHEDKLILNERRWTSKLVPYYLQKASTKIINNEPLACPLQAGEYQYDASKNMQRKDIASESKVDPKHRREHETAYSVELFVALGRVGFVEGQQLILGFLPSMNIEQTVQCIPKSIIHSTLGITGPNKAELDAKNELDAAGKKVMAAKKDMLNAYIKHAETKNNTLAEQEKRFQTLFKF